MKAEEFETWCIKNGGQTQAGKILDVHHNTIHNYCRGRQEIPRTIAYAVRGVESEAMHTLLGIMYSERTPI